MVVKASRACVPPPFMGARAKARYRQAAQPQFDKNVSLSALLPDRAQPSGEYTGPEISLFSFAGDQVPKQLLSITDASDCLFAAALTTPRWGPHPRVCECGCHGRLALLVLSRRPWYDCFLPFLYALLSTYTSKEVHANKPEHKTSDMRHNYYARILREVKESIDSCLFSSLRASIESPLNTVRINTFFCASNWTLVSCSCSGDAPHRRWCEVRMQRLAWVWCLDRRYTADFWQQNDFDLDSTSAWTSYPRHWQF